MPTAPSDSPPPSRLGGCWLGWVFLTLLLSALLPFVGFFVLLVGLFTLGATCRVAAIVLGLGLAACCIGCAVKLMIDLQSDDMPLALLFLPWAGFGVWLAIHGAKRK